MWVRNLEPGKKVGVKNDKKWCKKKRDKKRLGQKKSKKLNKKWGKKISLKNGVKIRLNMGENKLWLEAHSYK